MQSKLTFYLVLVLASLACTLTAPPAALRAAPMANTATPTEAATRTQAATATDTPTPPAALACSVTATALHVRTCGNLACPVSAWLREGDRVTIIHQAAGWYETPAGWIRADFCEVMP